MKFTATFNSEHGVVSVAYTLYTEQWAQEVRCAKLEVTLPTGCSMFAHAERIVNAGGTMVELNPVNNLTLTSRGNMERVKICFTPSDKPFKTQRAFVELGERNGVRLIDIVRPYPSFLKLHGFASIEDAIAKFCA